MKQNLKLPVWRAATRVHSSTQAQVSGDVVKIGFITDISGLYSDIDGNGGAEAIRMAIADFGGTVLGKKIVLVTADHQNKADIAQAARVNGLTAMVWIC
jgi:branched-chain amino acid transport system substrate-binding protein